MDYIDLTIDMETLALSPNAAILQIGAVAWDRNADTNPVMPDCMPFEAHVDLRSCVADGFEIDPGTVSWWQQRPEDVRREVFGGPAHPLRQVLESFVSWVDDLKGLYSTDVVYLWSQGSDFDIALLRNVFSRYGIDFPFDHGCFRDARTFILENGAMLYGMPTRTLADRERIYETVLPGSGSTGSHEALADTMRTTMQVWNVFRAIKQPCQ